MTSADELPDEPGTAAVPSFDALMWPTLQALKAMGGSGTNEELLAKVIEVANIAPVAQAVQHSDHRQTKLSYNLAWAKTFLKKAGAIDNSSRGVWSITSQGEALSPTEVGALPARVRRFFVDVMGVAGERDSARRHFSQCRAECNAAGRLGELPQAHVVPAFDHFAAFDLVGIAYV